MQVPLQLQVTGTGRTIMVDASKTMTAARLSRVIKKQIGAPRGSFALYHASKPMCGTLEESGVASGSTVELKFRGRGGGPEPQVQSALRKLHPLSPTPPPAKPAKPDPLCKASESSKSSKTIASLTRLALLASLGSLYSAPSLLYTPSSPALGTHATQMNDMPLDLSQSVSQVRGQRHPCTPLAPHPARTPFCPPRSRALIFPAQTRPAPLHLQPCGASLCAYRVIEPRESLFHPGARRRA